MKTKRRKSLRLDKNQGNNTSESDKEEHNGKSHLKVCQGKKTKKEELEYDADDDASPFESPILDPYEADMIEDLPLEENAKKTQTKKRKKTKGKTIKSKASTSTPDLTHIRKKDVSTDSSDFIITPEVTPIMPLDSLDNKSFHSDENFVTPQILRSARKKRKLSDGETIDLSAQISGGSQGDSGIVLSPPSKRRLQDSPELNLPDKNVKLKRKVLKSKKENKYSSDRMLTLSIEMETQSRDLKRPLPKFDSFENITNKTDDGCFGFDSIESPLFSPKSLQVNNSKKSRRSPRILRSDSSNGSPAKKDLVPMEMTENIKHSSPLLFCEDKDIQLNKGSAKVYGSNNTRSRKRQNKDCLVEQSSNKLEKWASDFNLHLEDVEKFELAIE